MLYYMRNALAVRGRGICGIGEEFLAVSAIGIIYLESRSPVLKENAMCLVIWKIGDALHLESADHAAYSEIVHEKKINESVDNHNRED